MLKQNERIIKEYSAIGDKLYYHHTITDAIGKSYSNEPSAHTQHEVLYLLSGELTYVIEGETYRVKKGDMIFVAPNEIHVLNIDGTKPYERIVLLFDMGILHGIMKALGTELRAFSYDGKNEFHIIKSEYVRRHRLDKILTEITETDIDAKYKKLDIIARLISFVTEIDRAISEGDGFKSPDRRDTLVGDVIGYVDRHIDEKIKLDELAEELFISKSTLCHKFATVMNVSLGRYITIKKMYHAHELMKSGISAHAAADAVGYENYTSFFYNYKKIMGRSPTSSHR